MSIEDREAFRLYRWDELPLEKVTEMVSRKIVSGTREMVAQHYMRRARWCRSTRTRASR